MSADWRPFQRRHGLVADNDPGPQTLAVVLRLERELADATPAPVVYSYGGPPIRAGIDRDPSLLIPAFAARLERLFGTLRDEGHQPILWEGLRSGERADELARRGTGAGGRRSMHLLGAAADIVHETELWSAPAAFWVSLEQHAMRLGLTSGRRWGDSPHVQAVSVAEQDAFRAMAPAARASLLLERLG